VVLLHQEGVLAVIALVGLALRPGGVVAGLASRGSAVNAVLWGLAAGAGCSLFLWLVRGLEPVARLERWQSEMVRGWTITDAIAVALFSGLAEEALLRALVQPLIGLLPAAAIFAVLHLIPDRRLWLWPVLALGIGVVLGGVFEIAGYPAAATAHIFINGLSLLRLRALPGG
jgi:hypothetical protein